MAPPIDEGGRPLRFRTRAIHVGNEKDPRTGAVVPPLHLASTYVQPGAGEWGEFDYSRSGNPTRANLEKTLASLESGVASLAFPLAFLVLAVVGVPLTLACTLSWAGYFSAARKNNQLSP